MVKREDALKSNVNINMSKLSPDHLELITPFRERTVDDVKMLIREINYMYIKYDSVPGSNFRGYEKYHNIITQHNKIIHQYEVDMRNAKQIYSNSILEWEEQLKELK